MRTGRTLLRICVYVGSVVAGSSPVGFVFVVNNLDFIRDKTIPAGQNADFGGFLLSKAFLPDIFWFGARSLVF